MRKVFGMIFVCGWLLAGPVGAQQDFSKVEIKTTDLGHRTYMMEGSGGNMTVAVGEDGAIQVDGEFAPLHDKIKAAVMAVSKGPVRYLVNTHYHGDHTGGNGPFAQDGIEIVAHSNVKKRLAEGTTNALTGAKTSPAAPQALPGKTYDGSSVTLRVKGRKAQLGHVKNAHTDGDTYVWFADANVLATGDIVTLGTRYPNIDVGVGGNIKGMIAGTDLYLKIANDRTKIVPGHGPLIDRAQLKEYRKMLVTARDRVARLIAQKKSEADAVAARPLMDIQTKIGASQEASDNFVRLVYRSLAPAKKA